MKAYNLYSVNDLRYEEIEKPQIKEGWALLKIKASGICSSDISRIFEKGTYHFPTIPGHEFSGIVESVGDPKDSKWIGKRVGVFPLIPCGKCTACKNRKYELCSHYNYLGSRCDGGFAEYAAVPVWNMLELPENVSYVQAAVFEPFAVALHAVKRAEIQMTDQVAVVGSGIIGFASAQWARKAGAKEVVIIGHNNEKRTIADKLGLEYTFLEKINPGQCFDRVIETVGTNDAIKTAIELTGPEGKIVLTGNPSGDILLPQNVYWKILRKQISVTGTWNSSFEHNQHCEWNEVCKEIASGGIDSAPLITHYYRQDDLADALNMMKEHKSSYCKVMVEWNE